VYEAEKKLKFVVIEPKRLIGKLILSLKDKSTSLKTFLISEKFGSKTAKIKVSAVTPTAKNT